MNVLRLSRRVFLPTATLGNLTIDGAGLASHPTIHTLEDPVRTPGTKILGKTAIPLGTYSLTITHSPRFKKELPLLHNVPNFQGVRIHAGNGPEDTEGCILVGLEAYPDAGRIGRSRDAMLHLMKILRSASKWSLVIT